MALGLVDQEFHIQEEASHLRFLMEKRSGGIPKEEKRGMHTRKLYGKEGLCTGV